MYLRRQAVAAVENAVGLFMSVNLLSCACKTIV